MDTRLSRRDAVKQLALVAGCCMLCRGAGAATAAGNAPPPHLQPTDPDALAVSYVDQADKIDRAKVPEYKPGQTCVNCAQIAGKDGEPWRPCVVLPNVLVSAAGWCLLYVKKA